MSETPQYPLLLPAPDAAPVLGTHGQTVGTISDDALYGLFLAGQDSADTKRAYDQSVRDFGLFHFGSAGVVAHTGVRLGAPVLEMLRTIKKGEAETLVDAYRANLQAAGRSPNTVNQRLAALRSLVTFGRRMGILNWTLETKSVKFANYRDTRGTGKDGFERILAAIEGAEPKAIRDRAIISMLYYLAMRRAKVASLSLADLNLDQNLIQTLRKGGGNQKFPRTIPPRVANALREWLTVRPAAQADALGDPVFVNLDAATAPQRISGTGIWKMVRQYGVKVGVRAWPHGLRHAAITEALDRCNGDVRRVQQFSEHKDANVLLRYDDNRKDEAGRISNLLAE